VHLRYALRTPQFHKKVKDIVKSMGDLPITATRPTSYFKYHHF
jgi:hypothetical protein